MQEINKELNNFALDALLKRIKTINKKNDLVEFLNCFLTSKEQLMVKKRLLLDTFLKEGKTYREIGELLGTSRNTISFIKKGLKRPPIKKKILKPITEKDLKKRKSRFPTISGKNRWRFLDVKY